MKFETYKILFHIVFSLMVIGISIGACGVILTHKTIFLKIMFISLCIGTPIIVIFNGFIDYNLK